jgi:hypothetical protein
MPYSTTAKNTMLNALAANRVRLHSGDPGAAGTSNQLGAGLETATFAAASGSERALSTDVTVTGLTALQTVTWFSVWNSTGPTFEGSGQITTGDTSASASGSFTLKATNTKLRITDS